MNLVLDCREAALIAQCRALLRAAAYDSANVVLEVRSLPLGDILMEEALEEGGKEEEEKEDDDPEGVPAVPAEKEAAAWSTTLLIERKAVPDLLASIVDGRYAEQSFRLQRHPRIPPHNVMYLLEGSLAALGAADRQKCYSALASCQYFKGFSICRTESLSDTAHYLVATVAKLSRELRKGKRPPVASASSAGATTTAHGSYASVVHTVKKNNLSSENIGAVFLAQIPGFSAASAECVMAAVPGGSMYGLLHRLETREGRDELRALTFGARKLGDAAVAKLCSFLRPDLVVADDGKGAAKKRKTTVAAAAGENKKRAATEKAAKKTTKKPRRDSSLFVSSCFPEDDEDDDVAEEG